MTKKKFTAQYSVTVGDINYGGHLGNERALVIFQDARVRFLDALGFSERNIGDDAGIILVESGVRYHREVFLHQELMVSVTVSELKAKKFTFIYEVIRQSDQQLVLSGFTAFLPFAYKERKVVRLPGLFKGKVGEYMAEG